jgi:hypothetical protein
LIAQGIKAGNWTLQNDADKSNPVLKHYLEAAGMQRGKTL